MGIKERDTFQKTQVLDTGRYVSRTPTTGLKISTPYLQYLTIVECRTRGSRTCHQVLEEEDLTTGVPDLCGLTLFSVSTNRIVF